MYAGMSILGDEQKLPQEIVSSQRVGGEGYEISVNLVTVDEYVNEDVLFMKVDVEGYELYALQGAYRLLSNHKYLF
jgi:FkbM family methyltransferase